MFKSKKIKTILLSILVILLLFIALFSFETTVLSTEEVQDEVTSIPEESSNSEAINLEEEHDHTHEEELQIVQKDVYLVEDSSITIDYLIDGNLFVISNDTVTISSEIGGSAFILAPNVIIENTGMVYYTAYILAETLTVKGQSTDLYSCSSNLTISDTAIIYRDIHSFAQTISFAGIVGRNASFAANTLTLTPGSTENTTGIIYGNLDYSSPNEISNTDKVVIGETNYTKTSTSENKTTYENMSNIVMVKIKSLISYLIFVLAICGLFKLLKSNYPTTSKQLLKTKTLPIFGIGFLALIAIPIVSIILLFSSFTIRISAILIFAYIILLFISTSIFVIALSEILCCKFNNLNRFVSLIISIIGLWLLGNIPFIGGLISFVSLIMGLGIIVLSLFNKTNASTPDNTEKIIEKNTSDTIEEISQDEKEEKILDNLIENITENKNNDNLSDKNNDNNDLS